MHTETHLLSGNTPGLRAELTVLHFGPRDHGPKAAVHAALHADEVPALLTAQSLRQRLEQLEADGQLLGEVRLVPVANPIGLGQRLLGRHEGRFDLRDGQNFNRGYPDLAAAVQPLLAGRLGDDAAANVALVRTALREAAQAWRAQTLTEHLKRRLLLNAIDCDVVLDLHCDAQAVLHLYALTPHADWASELGALVGAQAVLLAVDSGDGPFDEACSRPWLQLQQAWPHHPLPAACFAATVELRGEADVRTTLADADADALVAFLRRRGLVAGPAGPLPAALCEPTPLAASEPIHAPHAGIVEFTAEPGQRLQAGDAVATLVCPHTGQHTTLRCQSAGLLYARIATRWAHAGQRLAKVAGRTLVRTGKLLSA
jgi:predicted deacylase